VHHLEGVGLLKKGEGGLALDDLVAALLEIRR